jgi:hypothetical protein
VNAAHVAFQAPPVNTIGDAVVPRNFLHGPSPRRLGFSLFKDVKLNAAARLQRRIEADHVLNAVNFANPNGQVGNAAFGTISSTVDTPRQMQFAVKRLFQSMAEESHAQHIRSRVGGGDLSGGSSHPERATADPAG